MRQESVNQRLADRMTSSNCGNTKELTLITADDIVEI